MLEHRHKPQRRVLPAEQWPRDVREQYLGILIVSVKREGSHRTLTCASFVPHDQATLITTLGGPAQFVKRLNYLHDNKITYIGNEPAFLTVFQYHYAGRPGLSAKRSHYYIPAYFEPTPPGLPGNDDSGAMGSFVAFSMMGLFPNPGQDVYLITPPYFESVSIKSPVTGKTATIRNVNYDPTYQNIYIQNATLNGKPYTKNWIDHSFFLEGKTLVLNLGSTESSWGTQVADLPPSLGKYTGFSNGTTHSPEIEPEPVEGARRNSKFTLNIFNPVQMLGTTLGQMMPAPPS